MHGCSYFENDAGFYWEPVKLFEGRGDVRPTTKAENEPGAIVILWRQRQMAGALSRAISRSISRHATAQRPRGCGRQWDVYGQRIVVVVPPRQP